LETYDFADTTARYVRITVNGNTLNQWASITELRVQGGAQSGAGTTLTIGETNVLPGYDDGNGNLLVAQQATLGQPATIQSLSFYVTAAAGNLVLGIYDATGPGGGPGVKKAETAAFAPVVGWSNANVTTPVSLPAGSYWLAYLPSSNALAFRKAD